METAIVHVKDTLAGTQKHHPNNAGYSLNRGRFLAAYSSFISGNSGIISPIFCLMEHQNSGNGTVIGLRIGLTASAMLIFNIEDLTRAYSLLYEAIYPMPLVTSRSLEREDQQHILGQLSGLLCLAAGIT